MQNIQVGHSDINPAQDAYTAGVDAAQRALADLTPSAGHRLGDLG